MKQHDGRSRQSMDIRIASRYISRMIEKPLQRFMQCLSVALMSAMVFTSCVNSLGFTVPFLSVPPQGSAPAGTAGSIDRPRAPLVLDRESLSDRQGRIVDAAPGDVVFWDNTYDRSNNGLWGDPLTHAGVVISVTDDGTISFIHHNYRRGIVIETMNLLRPDLHIDNSGESPVVVNAPLRMQRDRPIRPERWLASHLHRDFAQLHRLNLWDEAVVAIK